MFGCCERIWDCQGVGRNKGCCVSGVDPFVPPDAMILFTARVAMCDEGPRRSHL